MLDKEKNKGELQPYLANINVRWGNFDFANLNQMRFESHEEERYGLRKNDLVICEGGEPGRCALWKEEVPDMKIQKALHRLRIHAPHDPVFIYYRFLLSGRIGELAKHFSGSTIKHLTGVSLKGIDFNFPSSATQQKIAAVLSALDAKIELNNKINAELEAMAKLLYDTWFVQFDFPISAAQAAALGNPALEGKPYKTSGGQMIQNPILKREIPAGWEASSIGTICKNVTNTVEPSMLSATTPYVGLEHVPRKSFILNSWSSAGNARSQKLQFTKNDFLFGKLRPYFHKVSQPPIDGICSTDILVLRPKSEIHREFVGSIIFEESFVDFATLQCGGTRMPRANWEAMSRYIIALPTHEVLERFNDIVGIARKSACQRQLQNQHLTTLRDWLLPMLMNGQVTVGGV